MQRRFNKIFTYRETIFFDDYAHHPTEIKEVLNGVRHVYKKEEVNKDLKKPEPFAYKNWTELIKPIKSEGIIFVPWCIN